jgi:hypothetical protein
VTETKLDCAPVIAIKDVILAAPETGDHMVIAKNFNNVVPMSIRSGNRGYGRMAKHSKPEKYMFEQQLAANWHENFAW